MATIGDLILRTEEILYGSGLFERPDYDAINGAIANGTATSMTIDTSGFLQRQDIAEFAPDNGSIGEIVRAAAVSGTTITIDRGIRNSTAAAQSDNALYRRNPAFTRVAIDEKIQHIMDTPGILWPKVWSWHHDSLTFTTDDHLYDLDAYVEDVVAVYQSDIDSDGKFAPIDPGLWDVERQINTSVSANSNLLRLGRVFDENTTVYYTGKRRPAYADLANVDASLANLIPRGAAALLLQDRGPQVDGSQRRSGKSGAQTLFAYGDRLYAQFLSDIRDFRRALITEVPEEPKYRPRFKKRW